MYFLRVFFFLICKASSEHNCFEMSPVGPQRCYLREADSRDALPRCQTETGGTRRRVWARGDHLWHRASICLAPWRPAKQRVTQPAARGASHGECSTRFLGLHAIRLRRAEMPLCPRVHEPKRAVSGSLDVLVQPRFPASLLGRAA